MTIKWFVTFIIIVICAPWTSGFLYSIALSNDFSFSAYAGLTMVAYSWIVTLPLFLITGAIGMICTDIQRPLHTGGAIGLFFGLGSAVIAIQIFNESAFVWLFIFTTLGLIFGLLEAALWREKNKF